MQHAPTPTTNWLQTFRRPPASHRPMPLWVWNGDMSERRATEMLENLAEIGCGGVFIHPRMGLVTEYLSPRWMELWEFSARECERLGMECHIYDENSFPTGFAGGHVPAAAPQTQARYLSIKRLAPGENAPTGTLALAGEEGGPRLAYVWTRSEPSLWTGGFSYVDLMLPETGREFLRCTHQAYARHLGPRLGRTVRYAFADEPEIKCCRGLACSEHFLREFAREHGYAFASQLPGWVDGGDAAMGLRHDYFRTVHRLWVESYLRPTHDWCAAHGLAFTGHFNEHQWPVPSSVPSDMAGQRWMQAPGIDLLGFQFQPSSLEQMGFFWFTVVQTGSIRRQMGRERSLCEAYGGGGYSAGPRDLRPLSDFILAGDINLVCPHLALQSLAGSRRYDWPQTLSDHAPWQAAYRGQADRDARVAWVLAQGRLSPEVLVLNPTTTGWLRYQPSWSDPWADGGAAAQSQPWAAAMRQTHGGTVVALTQARVEFDLGDELVLEELGRVEEGRLRVAEGIYRSVVLPAGMENIESATLRLLESFSAAGGRVLVVAPGPVLVDGRPEAGRTAWLRDPARVELLADTAALTARLTQRHPPRVGPAPGSTWPEGLLHIRKELPNGSTAWFFAYPWDGGCSLEVELPGSRAIVLDTDSGEARELPGRAAAGRVTARLELTGRGHALWITMPGSGGGELPAAAAAPRWGEPLAVSPSGVERVRSNALPLVFVEREGAAAAEHVANANWALWQAAGFSQPLWEWSVQFRRNFLERAVPPDSGLRLTYRFWLDPDAAAAVGPTLSLAVERPWLCRVQLNGAPLDFTGAERWFDEDIVRLPVGPWVRPGENRVELAADALPLRLEVAPVTVLGEFSVAPRENGFSLVSPRLPATGEDWKSAGLHFYSWELRQRFLVRLPRAARRLRVSARAEGAPAMLVRAGAASAWLSSEPWEVELEGDFAAGELELSLEVVGDFRNYMGPHFSNLLPGPWAWRASPAGVVPGEKYSIQPVRLLGAPQVRAAD